MVLYFGPRTDADARFGNAPPLSLNDVERDAELQEVQARFRLLKDSTERYLASYKTKERFFRFGLSVGVVLMLTVVGTNLYFLNRLAGSPPGQRQPHVATPLPARASSGPATAQNDPGGMAVVVAAPAPVPVALAIAVPASAPPPLPAQALVSPKAPEALAGAAQGKPAPKATPSHSAVPEQKVFVLETPSAAPGAETESRAKESPAKVAVPVVATPKPEPKPAAPAPAAKAAPADTDVRHQKYGSQGIITLTGSGVVVFDKERKAQRLVGIGGQLPDGSILRSVDQKSGRISTDRGDVVFD